MSTMRSIFFPLAIAIIGLLPARALAATPRHVTVDQTNLAKLSPADQQRVLCIADRLEEITTIDRSALSSDERKDLRAEVKTLRHEANVYNRAGGGTVIYISAGTIIIILLIILILT